MGDRKGEGREEKGTQQAVHNTPGKEQEASVDGCVEMIGELWIWVMLT